MRDPLPHLSLAAILLLLLPTDPLLVAVAMAALGTLALLLPMTRRDRAIAAGGLLAAAAVAAAGAAVSSWAAGEGWERLAARRFDRLLVELEEAVEDASEAVATLGPGAEDRPRAAAFDRLAELVEGGDPRWSYLLFDDDGEAVAWAGEGLLHDVDPLALREGDGGSVSSYTATTLYALHRLEPTAAAGFELAAPESQPASDPSAEPSAAAAGWLLAGRSFSRNRLPFDPGPGLDPGDYEWWLERPDEASRREQAVRVPTSRGVSLRVDREAAASAAAARFRSWAAAVLGAALLAVALERGVGGAAPTGERGVTLRTGVVATLGIAGLAHAAGASGPSLAALGLGAAVAGGWLALWPAARDGPLAGVRDLARSSRVAARSSRVAARSSRALAGAALPFAVAWAAQSIAGAPDLGERLLVAGDGLALRVAVVLVALAVLSPGRRAGEQQPGAARQPLDGFLVVALVLLLLAAASSDRFVPAVVLLFAGAATAIAALGARPGAAAGRWVTAVVVACLLAAVSWEIGYRERLRLRLEHDLTALAGPALEDRAREVAHEMAGYLESAEALEIARLPTTPEARQDLAVALWSRSPLARRDFASAFEIDAGDVAPSLFSYGLAIREGDIDPDSLPPVGVRAARFAEGEAVLAGPRGPMPLRWWGVPLALPAAVHGPAEMEIDLLRETPAPAGGELEGDAAFAVHAGGRPLLLPWPRRTPPEPAASGVARTPDGPAWYWKRSRDGVTYTLYLPRLAPLRGLERVGIHSVGTLLLAGALAAFGFLLVLGDDAFRARAAIVLHSYSRRLILILTVLIVLPLLALDAVLLRTLDDRLEAEHRKAAEVALVVAQRVLSDYLLAIEPGFGIRTVLEQEVLDWLAQVVDREVHVYWGARSFASSRPELFSSGLLPTRIPGDVFSELALREDALAARTRSAAGRTYLELYAPLDVGQPDAPLDRRFYLSTPLLAQEEEVSAALSRLVRRVVVVTVALLLLVLAVGARLAAGFTRPVMQIVEGTDRIAHGATALGLDPSEPELRTLVAAIDEMAARVAQGRAALLREKQVIETMVESIAAAVISLDRSGRVVLHNQVASALLGVEVGAAIAHAAAAAPIEGLAGFLDEARAGSGLLRRRLRSAGGEDREWSVAWVPVPGGGEAAALLVVEDVTEILRAQRLEAWAEMARIIAHEVKNPLTPIRLSTEHMQQVFADDPARFREVFERCSRNILLQVEELRAIASEFSTYSRVPHMDLRPGDLVGLARAVTAAYQAAPPPGVSVEFASELEAAPARFDEKLLGRALRNLLENAVRASRDRGEVEVRVGTADGAVSIEVSDRGPGVRAEDMARIFEPYFSTYDSGTGLGLPIARRIVEVHGGTITAANRAEGGLSVRITLPLLSQAC